MKNKEVMIFWSFANFHKTFLDQSIWICKWVSWWCHHLTTCHIFCTYNFDFFFLFFFLLFVLILPKLVIVCPSYHIGINIILHLFREELRQVKHSHSWNMKFLSFLCTKLQNEWKIVRRWHHQLTHLHIHIDWSRNVSWKFEKIQSVITSLFFNRFSSGFHYVVPKCLLFLLRLR